MEPEQAGTDLEGVPDAELGERYRALDRQAFQELWRRYRSRLRKVAADLSPNNQNFADRVLAQTLVRLACPEIRRHYDPRLSWADWACGQLKTILDDLAFENLPEGDLWLRYHRGESAAFRTLWFIRHREQVERWLLRLSFHAEHIQDDILNLAEARLMSSKVQAGYDPRRPWWPWALTVLRHEAAGLRRRLARDPTSRAVSLDPEVQPAPDRPDLERFSSDLHECLRMLPEEERGVIVLHFLEGKSRTIPERVCQAETILPWVAP